MHAHTVATSNSSKILVWRMLIHFIKITHVTHSLTKNSIRMDLQIPLQSGPANTITVFCFIGTKLYRLSRPRWAKKKRIRRSLDNKRRSYFIRPHIPCVFPAYHKAATVLSLVLWIKGITPTDSGTIYLKDIETIHCSLERRGALKRNSPREDLPVFSLTKTVDTPFPLTETVHTELG